MPGGATGMTYGRSMIINLRFSGKLDDWCSTTVPGLAKP